MAELAAELLGHFPEVKYAFAYGSGVFHQPKLYKRGDDAPMVDMIFAVDDCSSWHRENLHRNWSHYSFMRYLGPERMSRIADTLGVGVYFNTLVPIGTRVVKYGVIGRQNLMDDLQNWRHMYVAGRLHKPVSVLFGSADLRSAADQNLESAVATALLLSPRTWNLRDFLRRACSLSYLGDVRMGVAEDSRKVHRIVEGSYDALSKLYAPHLQGPVAHAAGLLPCAGGGVAAVADINFRHDTGAGATARLIAMLPQALLLRVAALGGHPVAVAAPGATLTSDTRADVAAALAARRGGVRPLILSAVAATVRSSSLRQMLVGALSAGPSKSLAYVSRKLVKAWR